MKNAYFETQRRLAKQWHRCAKTHYSPGGIANYDEIEDDQSLAWQTKMAFVINNYRVEVRFEHPRYVYSNKIDQLARNNVEHIRANDDWLNNLTPITHRLGKSRKKILGYRQNGLVGDIKWIQAFWAGRARLKAEADFVIAPSIKVQWRGYCRLVKLCAPIEIRNYDDLLAMAMLVKRILKQETSLECEFPGYVYCREDWLSELKTNSDRA